MFSKENKNRYVNNIFIILFIIFISITIFLSKVFKTEQNVTSLITQNLKLFKPEELIQINKIHLKNKNGIFEFEKTDGNQSSTWHMITPKASSGSSIYFESLFSFLSTSNIKKIYPNDKINNSNFSLETPLATVSLTTQNNVQINLEIGLSNTIDNSLYIKSSSKPGIIHIEAPLISFENTTLSDLIESLVFSLNIDKISMLRIVKNKKSSSPLVDISKKNLDWMGADKSKISSLKLVNLIQELNAIKTSFILEKQTELQKKQIGIIKKSLEYFVTIQDTQNNSIEYSISGPVKELSDVETKGEQLYIISTSSSPTIYLIKKDLLQIFDTSYEKLKDLN